MNYEIRPLTAKGLRDAKKVTEILLNKNIDVILSSPFKRAVDTVKNFAQKTGKDIIIKYDLSERKVDDVWVEDFKSFAMKR